MDSKQNQIKSLGEKTETQMQETPVAQAAVGEGAGKNNQTTESPKSNRASLDAESDHSDIRKDYLVQYLMSSAIVGWQLYAMARSMFDELQFYSEEDKEKHFGEIAKKAITDDSGNMVKFRPVDTINSLKAAILPFWLAKLAAEAEVARFEKENAVKAKS